MTDHTTRLASQLLKAVIAHFDSQRQNALATIDLYLHNPVAIGDHPDLVAVLIKATSDLAAAEEAMDSIERNFLSDQAAAPTPPEETNG
jgi:NCAIR mutase (PurE)-related protein